MERSGTWYPVTLMNNQDYSAQVLRTDNGCLLELVPEFGGLTNRLRFVTTKGPLDVIVGLPDRDAMVADKYFRGIPIFPVVNRLRDGRYSFEGKEYQLPVNETSRNNALHGLLHHLTPKVEVLNGENFSEAKLIYTYKGEEKGYPFPVDVIISYHLKTDSSLEAEFYVHNRHHAAIPVGIGWHPWFGLGLPLDELHLKLPKVQRLAVDSRLLPTGERPEDRTFEQLHPLDGISLDDCFAVQQSAENETVSVILWSEKNQLGVEMWQQTGTHAFNFIQVCTAPDRQSVAIEPVSCGIDAFNTGDGLITLPADDSFTARMGVRLVTAI